MNLIMAFIFGVLVAIAGMPITTWQFWMLIIAYAIGTFVASVANA